MNEYLCTIGAGLITQYTSLYRRRTCVGYMFLVYKDICLLVRQIDRLCNPNSAVTPKIILIKLIKLAYNFKTSLRVAS